MKQQLKQLQERSPSKSSASLVSSVASIHANIAKHEKLIQDDRTKLQEKCKLAVQNRSHFQSKLAIVERQELNLESDRLILEESLRSTPCVGCSIVSRHKDEGHEDAPNGNGRKLSSLERVEKRRAKRKLEVQ